MPFWNAKPRHRRTAADGPVFVDPSGRRLRRARITGLVALSGVIAYVGLVGSAFLGGPDIIGPLLPEALAPHLHSTGQQPLETPTPTPSNPKPQAPDTDGTSPAHPSPDSPSVLISPSPVDSPVVSSPAAPSTHGASPPTQPPDPSRTAGRSATAPGQANRPAGPHKP